MKMDAQEMYLDTNEVEGGSLIEHSYTAADSLFVVVVPRRELSFFETNAKYYCLKNRAHRGNQSV